jgi:tripartite-type tricarboxylate transporter receptor subunit TctC
MQGFDPGGTTPAEFAALLRNDLARWQKVIRDGNIRAE